MAHIIQDDGYRYSVQQEDGVLIPDADARQTLDLNFGSLQFLVEGITESLPFLAKQPYRRLVLHSSSGQCNLSGYAADDEIRLIGDLLQRLAAAGYAFEAVEIRHFAFRIPIRPLARLLRQVSPTLRHLTLAGSFLSGFQGDDAALRDLCSVLEGLNNLETFRLEAPRPRPGDAHDALRLLYCRIMNAGASKSIAFSLDVSELMGGNSSRWMFRNNNQLAPVDARDTMMLGAVGAVLQQQHPQRMEQLTLSLCDMGSIQPIATALKHNRSLKTIQFTVDYGVSLDVPSEIVQAFKDALMRDNNCILEHVTVVVEVPNGVMYGMQPETHQFAELSSVDDPAIALYLKLNQAGRHQLLESGTSTRRQWIDTIIDNRDDTRVVHYFLSKNPSLCVAV